jgi:hypothetical protein
VNRENKSNTNKFSVVIAGIFERYRYTFLATDLEARVRFPALPEKKD